MCSSKRCSAERTGPSASSTALRGLSSCHNRTA